MIDPHAQEPEILKLRFSLHMVKDDWPPPPEILKFRFSLHMVKDDWPHPTDCPWFYQKF